MTDYSLDADAGAFALTGQDAGLLAARRFAAGAGSYAATFEDADLRATRRLAAQAGAFAATFPDSALIYEQLPRRRRVWWDERTSEQSVPTNATTTVGRVTYGATAGESYWILASVTYRTGTPSVSATWTLEDDTGDAAVPLHVLHDNARVLEDVSCRLLLIGRVAQPPSGARSVRVTGRQGGTAPITVTRCLVTVLTARPGDRYAAADAPLSNATTALRPQVELAWTAAYGGETFIVAATAEMRSSTGNRALIDLWDGSTSRGNADTRYRTGVQQYCSWAEVVPAELAGPQVWQVRCAAQQADGVTQVGASRILALVALPDEGSYGAEARGKSTTTASAYAPKVTASGAAAAGPHLVLGRASVDVADTTNLVGARLSIDGGAVFDPPSLTRTGTANVDTPAAFLAIDVVPAPGDREWSIDYASVNGAGIAGIYGASIAVLELADNTLRAGSFAVTGGEARLRRDRRLLARVYSGDLLDLDGNPLMSLVGGTIAAADPNAGPSFVATPGAAELSRTLGVIAAEGVFWMEPGPTRLLHGRRVPAGAGAFTVTGQAARLGAARRVGAGAGAFAVTGQAAGLRATRRLVAGAGAFAVSGQDARLVHGIPLPAGAGAFAVTGQDARLLAARRLVAARGFFEITGRQIDGAHSYRLAAGAGAFAVAGQVAGLRTARRLAAGAGSYGVTGQAATPRVTRRLAAGAGAYALAGQQIGAVRSYRLAAGTGAFAVTGQDGQPLYGYLLPAEAGSFVVTDQDATLRATRRLAAGAGSFVVTGQVAGLRTARRLVAGAGSYTVEGQGAQLRYAPGTAAQPGSYTITGGTIGGRFERRLVAGAGQYEIQGQDARLLVARRLQATPYGGYLIDLDGNPLLDEDGNPIIDLGPTFRIRGSDAELRRGLAGPAEAGSYTITGQDIGAVRSYRLSAEHGAFVVRGGRVGEPFVEVTRHELKASAALRRQLLGSAGLVRQLDASFRPRRVLRASS